MDVTCFVTEVAAESRHCLVPLTASEPQHIVGGSGLRNGHLETVGCGDKLQPWSVEALAGQQITVSLIDFGQMCIIVCHLNTVVTHCTFMMVEIHAMYVCWCCASM